MDNKHYICVGECEGVSKVPGTCQATDCNRYHEKLVECHCADGDHRVVREEIEDEIEE